MALGGAAGAVARFAIGGWAIRWTGPGFPWATLSVNIAGSLLLGTVLRGFATPEAVQARAFLAVGFCGAFTTFSTFGYEIVALIQDQAFGTAITYVAASVAASVLAVFAGLWLGAHLA